MERAAVAAAPESVMLVRAHYVDDSDVPGLLDLGVVTGVRMHVATFRNRYDDATCAADDDGLAVQLAGATDAQIGALGEETAAVLIEDVFDATIVAMGDAGMPRDGARQDLDLLVIVDGALIAYEVKTRYLSTRAGRLTRVGNLPRPRLRRAASPTGHRQGSQAYVAQRLDGVLDIDDGYEGIEVRVIAIDFRAMLAQEFLLNDTATRLQHGGPPMDCRAAAERALARIVNHRGHL
jgi:hypothetical protein